MNEDGREEKVVVTTVVSIDPTTAFEIFTEDIDLWWKRGARFRAPGDATIRFEPGPAGRLVAEDGDGAVREIGRIIAWQPDRGRLVFAFRAANFGPGEVTEVEVSFEPVDDGTRVTLEHRGLDALRKDHPARHGLEGSALVALYGTWWADLLVSMRSRIEAEGSGPRG